MDESFTFQEESLYQTVCGIGDSKLPLWESRLNVKLIPRGKSLIIQGSEDQVQVALDTFHKVEENFKRRPDKAEYSFFDIDYLVNKVKDSSGGWPTPGSSDFQKEGESWTPRDKIFVTFKGKPIFPRTKNQESFVDSLHKNYITIAMGPAGTGKTFLSIATACRMMQTGEVDRLILTRPAVEAGENLGFLPGDLTQKVNPYLRPIYDALHECIGFEKTTEYLQVGKIEIAPIAFMRGRTLSHSFIILDEAQNCTLPQLKMFLTRFGKNSKMAISGDATQIDLAHGRSGLEKTVYTLRNLNGIETIFFGREDITRHPIVESIVRRFEENESLFSKKP
ncbi:PhoH family protein [Leptospira wolbachii serovar Codice str. CDC]|uniref:PhoH-like protein n=2 Tax=Leptospira TaxID=171 RepID=R9A7N4_9LEPT|nr:MULTISPECIES: PhoH family protein [Leptospira]EOQ98127.1 PhoH family protein [Leptospira wolbachii serovar Codice str. CDC]TGM60757.1 PhoH family protein [Leptospira vanthielii]